MVSKLKNKIRMISVGLLLVGVVFASMPVSAKSSAVELELDLWYMPVERPYFPDAKSVAVIMQANLKSIGVKTNLVTYEWGEYLDRTEDGDHDMALLGWSADIGHPDNFMHVLLHGDSAIIGTAMNIAFYNSTPVNDLLTEARQTVDQAVAAPLYEEACSIIHRDSPWVTVAHSQNLAGVDDDVDGFVTHPTGPGANVYGNVTKGAATSLIIARGGDAVTLDPAEWTDGQSWKVGRQIYDGLYNLPADSIEPEPALATSYSASPDGLTWNFTLRQGVKFHDGSDFNASAVVFSFERAANWNNLTSPYYTNGWVPPEEGYYDYIYGGLGLNVTALDTYTVQFEMNKPYSPFLPTLAMSVFSIVSPTYVKAHPGTDTIDRIGLNPCGTGPYEITDWTTASSITLNAFDDYWGAAAATDELVFRVIDTGTVRISELLAGTVDIVDNVAATDAATVETGTGVTLTDQAGMNIGYLAMNELKWPFNDTTAVADPDFGGMTTKGALVRRAFNYAIDRDQILDAVYQGRAIKAKNPLPPSFWGYNDSVEDYPYDRAHAQEILYNLGFEVAEPPSTDTGSVSTSISVSTTISVSTRQIGPEPLVALVSTFGAFAAISIVVRKRKKN